MSAIDELDKSWQQDTPTKFAYAASYSRGISNLEWVTRQINVLHLTLVGISYDLCSSFPPNIGADFMEQQSEISASIASILHNLEVYSSAVKTVASSYSLHSIKNSGLNTSQSTDRR